MQTADVLSGQQAAAPLQEEVTPQPTADTLVPAAAPCGCTQEPVRVTRVSQWQRQGCSSSVAGVGLAFLKLHSICASTAQNSIAQHRWTRRSSLGQLDLWICMPHMVFQAICKVDRGGVHHPWPHSSRQPAQQQQPHCVAASPVNRQPSTAPPTLLSSIRAVAVSAAAAGSPTVQHQHQWRGVHTQKHQQQCVRRNVPVSTCANMQGADHLPR